MPQNENAAAGVNYGVIKPFKDLMVEVGRRTRHLCEKRGVFILPTVNGHGVPYEYRGEGNPVWVATKEGLGNKAWIAMLLNQLGYPDPTGQFHMGGIGIDTFRMGSNDNAAQGAQSVILTDEVSCGVDEFFGTAPATALAGSFEYACVIAGCSMGQGESPAYKYLMQAAPPVKYAPSLSVCVIGIVPPTARYISGEGVRPGHIMIGYLSSGLHSNGISPIIRRVPQLKDGFLTPLNGHTVGEECLIPTRSYSGLVEALQNTGVVVDAWLPCTGDGIAKIGSDERFHYVVEHWLPDEKIPPLFLFMEKIGVPRRSLADTWNCGIGYIAFVHPDQVDSVMEVSAKTPIDGEEGFYEPLVLGRVEEGPPGTDFQPWKMQLPPPGKE